MSLRSDGGIRRWCVLVLTMGLAAGLQAQVSVNRFPLSLNVQWTMTYNCDKPLDWTPTNGPFTRSTTTVRITSKDLLNLASNGLGISLPKGARMMLFDAWHACVTDKSGTNVLGDFWDDSFDGLSCFKGRGTFFKGGALSQGYFVNTSGSEIETVALSLQQGVFSFDLHLLSKNSYSLGAQDKNGNFKGSCSRSATVLGQGYFKDWDAVISGTLSASGRGMVQVIDMSGNSTSSGGGNSGGVGIVMGAGGNAPPLTP